MIGTRTVLTGTKRSVAQISFVPEEKLVLAPTGYSDINVYNLVTTGAPRNVFKHHEDEVMGVAHLEGDIVASVDFNGTLLSWRAATGELVDRWEHNEFLTSVAKVGKDRLVVGDTEGTMIVLEHKSGSSFRVVQLLNDAHSDTWVEFVLFRNSFVLSLSYDDPDDPVELWSATSLAPLATLRPGEHVHSAAVSDRSIVLASESGNVYAYRNSDGSPLDFVIRLTKKSLRTIAFVNEDVVAVSERGGNLYFVSFSVKSILSKMKLESVAISIVVLSDGRLALGCGNGYSAFIEPPESVREIVANGAVKFYSDSLRTITGKRPSQQGPPNRQDGQLEMWKEIGVSKESVRTLKCDEVAACLAAFLVNYEPKFSGRFKKCKDVLVEHFRKSFAFGETLADCDEEERKVLPDAVMEGLAKVVDGGSCTMMRMRVNRFARLAAE